MTRHHQGIRDSWFACVLRAIELGEEHAAYALTVAFLRRLRELGVV